MNACHSRTCDSWQTKLLSGGDSSLFKWRGDKSEIVILYWKYLKFLSLKLLGQFQQNLAQSILGYLWVDGIQLFTNKGPHPSSREDNSKIIKIYGEYLKNFYFRTTRPISTKIGIKHPWVGSDFSQLKNHALLQEEIIAYL